MLASLQKFRWKFSRFSALFPPFSIDSRFSLQPEPRLRGWWDTDDLLTSASPRRPTTSGKYIVVVRHHDLQLRRANTTPIHIFMYTVGNEAKIFVLVRWHLLNTWQKFGLLPSINLCGTLSTKPDRIDDDDNIRFKYGKIVFRTLGTLFGPAALLTGWST